MAATTTSASAPIVTNTLLTMKCVRSVTSPVRNTFCGRKAKSFSSGTNTRKSSADPDDEGAAPHRTTKTSAATNVSPATSRPGGPVLIVIGSPVAGVAVTVVIDPIRVRQSSRDV